MEGEKGSGPGEVAGGQSPEQGPSLGPGHPSCETLRSAHQHTPLPLTSFLLGGAWRGPEVLSGPNIPSSNRVAWTRSPLTDRPLRQGWGQAGQGQGQGWGVSAAAEEEEAA